MVLKITRDELPVEQGVHGGCLLFPLYPLLASLIALREYPVVGKVFFIYLSDEIEMVLFH